MGNNLLSSCMSEIWSLGEQIDAERIDMCAFGAPEECYHLLNIRHSHQARAILTKYEVSPGELELVLADRMGEQPAAKFVFFTHIGHVLALAESELPRFDRRSNRMVD